MFSSLLVMIQYEKKDFDYNQFDMGWIMLLSRKSVEILSFLHLPLGNLVILMNFFLYFYLTSKIRIFVKYFTYHLIKIFGRNLTN